MNSAEANNQAEQYRKYLNIKGQLLAEFGRLTDNLQAELNKDQGNIAGLLSAREQIIAKVDTLDKETATLSQYFGSVQGEKLLSILPVGSEVKQLAQGNQALLKSIIEKDTSVRKVMNTRYQELGQQIKKIKTGKRMRQAYDADIPLNEGVFVDFKK